MELQKFVRNPMYVNAVQVTRENLRDVASWCGGTSFENIDGPNCIKVLENPSKTISRTKAFVGDWVLEGRNGFRVYTNAAFKKSFEPVPMGAWPRSHDEALKTIEATEKDFINSLNDDEKAKYLADISKHGKWSPTHEEALKKMKGE